MDAFADDNRLRLPPLTLTRHNLFFITLIEIQGLKRILTAKNEFELGIAIVLTGNTIYLFFNQQKPEFWHPLAV